MNINIDIEKKNNIGELSEKGYLLKFSEDIILCDKLELVENDGYNIIFEKNGEPVFKIKFVCTKIDGFNRGELEFLHSVESLDNTNYCFIKRKGNINIKLDFSFDNVRFVRLYHPFSF